MSSLRQTALENKIGYNFSDRTLLETALRHSSYVNEQAAPGLQDNERLEFLGDAVLSLVISHLLMARFPDLKEGELSKTRSSLVNESRLAMVAKKINLGGFICLGKGEARSEGNKKSSILADAFEALVAAVYLDGGFKAAFGMINGLFTDLIKTVREPEKLKDYKTRLQELAQAKFNSFSEYRVVGKTGPDHDKTFTVELRLGEIRTRGIGKSKKAAEQEAAEKALALLDVKE